MLTKIDQDYIRPFLSDASYLSNGAADRLVFPTSSEDIADVLKEAAASRTPVTVSGAGTGTVGGRIPSGGIILATDKLARIQSISCSEIGGSAVAEAGVPLADLQRFVEAQGLIYPPDPTERSCYLGGTIATNASGSRTFKYGPTRDYIRRLKIVLSTGDIIDLRRGDLKADAVGRVSIPLLSGDVLQAQLPTYQMPRTRKHACGYYVAPGMDVIDLFIGSEGTLGVVVEAEVGLLPKPQGLLTGVVFFDAEQHLLSFAGEVRSLSLQTRVSAEGVGKFGNLMERALAVTNRSPAQSDEDRCSPLPIDARALEYFDNNSLDFLRTKYETIPKAAVGAVFFEQETNTSTEEEIVANWMTVVERNRALSDSSWFAMNESDHARLREFRHALPVLMNEWFARHNQRKVSTDMSVPDEAFDVMLRYYHDTLRPTGLRYTVFGHIGDNHVHVNILPRDDSEAAIARDIYLHFVKRAIELGGTLSAEHGIGKLKRDYLKLLYTEDNLREMAALKRAFDPAGILGRGNMFDEKYLAVD
ncbi:MAG TPA: FAD-binding oxidoreductase [Pyrinomonadaceae bacterium]|nr:FAD-binding oxidoreductase [Pyrinomonadaceae bacterium]